MPSVGKHSLGWLMWSHAGAVVAGIGLAFFATAILGPMGLVAATIFTVAGAAFIAMALIQRWRETDNVYVVERSGAA